MATNHTENYNLNLWEPTDTFLRTEFNENTQKLDAALKSEADARTAADAALQAAVNTKADASTVTALTQTVNTKADAAALDGMIVTGSAGTRAYMQSKAIDLGFYPHLVILFEVGECLEILTRENLYKFYTRSGSPITTGTCNDRLTTSGFLLASISPGTDASPLTINYVACR